MSERKEKAKRRAQRQAIARTAELVAKGINKQDAAAQALSELTGEPFHRCRDFVAEFGQKPGAWCAP